MMTFQSLNAELITAIVTPFDKELKVDHPALERLTQHLIDTGSDGILVNGSTGESPTVSRSEKIAILKTVKQVIGNQPVKLIAGSGTNDTQTTIDMCRETEAAGVDALLVVVPYYNKPSQKGMLAHYGAIAQSVEAPVIIYNIPGRSIVNMLPETMVRLAEQHRNIIGVKQSNPDMDQVSDIRRCTPEQFRIWCGDDSLTLPMMSLGAYGSFSVASHLTGQMIRDMIRAFKNRNMEQALRLHLRQMDVFKEIFFLPNPTVVKTCLAKMGLIQGYLRLPLVEPEGDEMKRIDHLMTILKELSSQHVMA
jgi:4-hydroxy-tetrahydrodipicolinate synthase